MRFWKGRKRTQKQIGLENVRAISLSAQRIHWLDSLSHEIKNGEAREITNSSCFAFNETPFLIHWPVSNSEYSCSFCSLTSLSIIFFFLSSPHAPFFSFCFLTGWRWAANERGHLLWVAALCLHSKSISCREKFLLHSWKKGVYTRRARNFCLIYTWHLSLWWTCFFDSASIFWQIRLIYESV